jgi:hypothetical protein
VTFAGISPNRNGPEWTGVDYVPTAETCGPEGRGRARFATIKWQPFDSYSLCPELRMRTSITPDYFAEARRYLLAEQEAAA